MLKKLPYNKLESLGVIVWQPRNGRHPATPINSIVADHIRINARCLVLSYCTNGVAEALNPEEQKIFNGMVSVLELASTQIMHATIYAPSPDPALISAYMQEWQPEFILQLSMELPDIYGHYCVRTFSPAYLLHNPQYKSQAFKTLLGLRAMLHGTSKSNS